MNPPALRHGLLGFALLLTAVTNHRAADLSVNQSNSPFSFTTGTASYDNVYVGQVSTGVLNQSGGTLAALTGQLFVGYAASGTFNLSGGTLNTVSTDVGEFSTGVFTLSGSATHNVTGSLDLGVSGGSNGTYNLNGGTLSIGAVHGGGGGSVFNFNSGTLRARADATDFFQDVSTAYVRAGGASIETAGFNVTIAQNLLHDTSPGMPSSDGGLTKRGNGTLTLTGANTYAGVTNLNAGALQVGDGGASGNLGAGDVANNASLIFNRSGAFTVANRITGSGSLTKTGAGALTLTGANVYQGGTTFAAGVLNAGSALALGSSGTLSFTGGTLQYGAANATDYSARFSTADNQAFSVDTNGRDVTFATGLGGNGGSLTKLGNGVLTLTATPNYTGPTTASGGLLVLSGGAYTPVFVNNNGSLQVPASATVQGIVGVGGNGDTGGAGGTAATLGGAGALTNNGTITGGTGGATSSISRGGAGGAGATLGGTATLINNGTITGGTGGDNRSLSGEGGAGVALTGGTLVNGGSINGGLGGPFNQRGNGPGVVASGAAVTLVNRRGGSIAAGVTLGNFPNAVTLQAGSSINGGLNVGTSTAATLTLTDDGTGGNQAYSSAVPGTTAFSGALVKSGPGTWTLTQAFSPVGGTTVSAGALAIGSGGSLNAPGALVTVDGANAAAEATLSVGAGGSVSADTPYVGYNGVGTLNQTGGSVTANNGVLYLGFNAGSNGAYNLSGGSLTTAGTTLRAGTSSFTQSGGTNTTVTLMLSDSLADANVAYNLNGGTLAASAVTRVTGTGIFNFNGGTLQARQSNASFFQDLTAAYVQAGGARIDTAGFNVILTQNLLHDPTLVAPAADGGLTKLGAGTLTLGGANTFTGVSFAAGVLNAGSAGALGSSGPMAFAGGTLQYSDANATDYSARFSTAARQTFSIDTNGRDVAFATALTSSAGGLTKRGEGTLTLAGANLSAPTGTVLGNFIVDRGVLALNDGASVIVGTTTIGGSGAATINQTGGSFSIINRRIISIGSSATGSGAYNLSGTGILSTSTVNVGNSGPGTFNQSGGTFTTNGNSLYLGSFANASGAYNLSGTGSLSTGEAYVGSLGASTFNQSGGSFTTNGAPLYVGYNTGEGAVNSYTLSGGTLATGRTQVSDSANTGVFTQSGGTHTTGTLALTGFSTGSVGSYSLNGGTLNVGAVTSGDNGVSGTSTFNFNGGTLQASASSPAFFQNLTAASVQAAGARVDTAGFDVTIAQTLASGTAGGTPDGGLTKLGAGVLTLSPANTYTGTTTVRAGLLLAANPTGSATGTGAVTVNGGGALGGNGAIAGAVTVESGGTLAPGALAPSQLTLGDTLALQPGSTLAITIGGTTAGDGGYDQVRTAGPSTLLGSLAVRAVNGFAFTLDQSFTILENTGGATLTLGAFTNAPTNLYTNAAGETFFVNYAADVDGGPVANDVTLTYRGVTAVPEPNTCVLLGAGLVLLGFSVRRRRARPGPHLFLHVRSKPPPRPSASGAACAG